MGSHGGLTLGRARWIHGARLDTIVAFAWVPFAVGAALVPADSMRWYAMGVLVLSLLHQPVTIALVYADGDQLRAHRRLAWLAPLVLAAAILVGLRISFLLVSVIGGLWNTEHTLMQRYGFTRIYRRKGGDTGAGRRDLHLLAGWLGLVLAWAVVDPLTPERIESLQLGTANERSLQVLVDLRPYAVVLMALAAIAAGVATLSWFRAERATGFDANPATYLYLSATAGLFLLAVVNPVAALLGWVGAHAIEYFVIVGIRLRGRADAGAGETAVDRVIARRHGVVAFVAASSLVGAGVVLAAQFTAGLTLYGLVFFMVGGLHIFFDGVIWKLRRPQVASALAISA